MLLRNVIFDIILPVVVSNACEGEIFNTPGMDCIIKSNIHICRLPQNVTSVSNQKLLCNVIMIHCPTVVCNFRPPISPEFPMFKLSMHRSLTKPGYATSHPIGKYLHFVHNSRTRLVMFLHNIIENSNHGPTSY